MMASLKWSMNTEIEQNWKTVLTLILIPPCRLKNDLVKDNPYLLMENESFGKNLIDTDAQVIILMNIIYIVTVGESKPSICYIL